MPKKLLISLASVLALATFAMAPAVAPALQFKINGKVTGSTHTNVTVYGALTLKSEPFGEFKCKIVAGAPVWNEAEKGLNAVEGWEPFICKYVGSGKGCEKQSFITAEGAVELIEEKTTEKTTFKAKRGLKTLPWPGEPFETTEKTNSINMHKIKMYIDCPTEGLEVPYEGNLEPKWVNGVKNGLSPSRLVFEGEGGKTSWLATCSLHGCFPENKESELFVSGELFELGTSQQLIQLG
jgi:hypothetical protein